MELSLTRESRLIERHELAEVFERLPVQATALSEAQRHLRRQVALPVHHELQVIRRAQPSPLRERAERVPALALLVVLVELAQERPVVPVPEYVDAGPHAHDQQDARSCRETLEL